MRRAALPVLCACLAAFAAAPAGAQDDCERQWRQVEIFGRDLRQIPPPQPLPLPKRRLKAKRLAPPLDTAQDVYDEIAAVDAGLERLDAAWRSLRRCRGGPVPEDAALVSRSLAAADDRLAHAASAYRRLTGTPLAPRPAVLPRDTGPLPAPPPRTAQGVPDLAGLAFTRSAALHAELD